MTLQNRKTYRDGTRVYTDRDGNVYHSVTTILNNIAKPALRNWVGKQVAEYAVTHKGAWTMLDDDAAIDLLKRSPYRTTNRAANLGTLIHEIAENIANGAPITQDIPVEAEGRIAAFHQFVIDHQPQFTATELTVYNATHGYAGTGDLWAVLHGLNAIIDIKTGKGVYPEVTLQTTAYANAEFTYIGDDKAEPPAADVGFVLHLTDAGYRLHPLNINHPDAMATVAALAQLHRWQQTAKETIAPALKGPIN